MNDDPETQFFALDFEMIFSLRGWKVSWYTESYGDTLATGIRLPDGNPEDAAVIVCIRAAFQEAGIEFSTDRSPFAFQTTGPWGVPPVGPRAIMYVGPKPPIGAEWDTA